MSQTFTAILTTIQPPTPSVKNWMQYLGKYQAPFIIIGDKKGPQEFNLDGTDFYSLEQQLQLPLTLPELLPSGHYARKNVGYQIAFARNTPCIYETDDDNAPLPTWTPRAEEVKARTAPQKNWFNVYRCFSQELLWPRGFPLENIKSSANDAACGDAIPTRAPIQQGLANGSPDVDAVYRLVLDKDIVFADAPSVSLPQGVWCPFNSQSTWWRPEAYPLLYLPSFCSFRMTDIWRSFIAQRCLWAMNRQLVFHTAEVVQERNEHRLIRDFEDEIPGYINNTKIIMLLQGLTLQPGAESAAENLSRCYEALVIAGFIPEKELPLVQAWVTDYQKIFGEKKHSAR
jgi:hypothetical protein